MTASLPLSPNLGFYRKRAKDLRRAHGAGSADAAALIRAHHPRHASHDDATILAAPFALADAQLVVARQHGFPSWSRFRSAVRTAAENPALTPSDRALAAIRAGDLEGLTNVLTDAPAAAATPATSGELPLVEACQRGDLEMTRALLDAGADPLRGDAHFTPVLAAAHAGPHKAGPALPVVALLQERGAPDDVFTDALLGRVDAVRARLDPSRIDERGPVESTALFLAVWNRQTPVVRLLLEAGADPSLVCRAGMTALRSALLHSFDARHREIGHLLLDHGAPCTLSEACELGHLSTVARLARETPEALEAPNERGWRAVDLAVLRGNRELASALLEAGASDPDGRARALIDATPEIGASHAGHVFRRSSFRAAAFYDVDLANTTFYDVNLSRAWIGYVTLAGARIESGQIQGLTIWGVEVEPLLLRELERRRQDATSGTT